MATLQSIQREREPVIKGNPRSVSFCRAEASCHFDGNFSLPSFNGSILRLVVSRSYEQFCVSFHFIDECCIVL
ncbi:hypothetical protein Nepgr_020043 [Nepenthes gracilis]|uniref:Uncharacterized protein n=1 Tax=Nepenthes gracilis TaxID=150966 RepID=A0AAD3SWC5_NEPGR|nr:hypothetical protein Nepgr_020043 [Nepenthes gracilis]